MYRCPYPQVFYVPLIIVAAIAVARVDGVHFTSVAAMLSPFWLLDLCAICGKHPPALSVHFYRVLSLNYLKCPPCLDRQCYFIFV